RSAPRRPHRGGGLPRRVRRAELCLPRRDLLGPGPARVPRPRAGEGLTAAQDGSGPIVARPPRERKKGPAKRPLFPAPASPAFRPRDRGPPPLGGEIEARRLLLSRCVVGEARDP